MEEDMYPKIVHDGLLQVVAGRACSDVLEQLVYQQKQRWVAKKTNHLRKGFREWLRKALMNGAGVTT